MSLNNKEIIKRIYKEYSKSNKVFYLDFITDDVSWKIVGMPEIKGKINFLKMKEELGLQNFPTGSVTKIIAEDEYVVVESIGNNKSFKDFSSQAYCDIYHLKKGKINQLTTYVIDAT